MVTDFQERLRQIREERDRQSRARQVVEAATQHERNLARELRFERREQLERTIEALSDKFISEVPTFERTKSFFEGKYKIEVGTDDLFVDEDGVPRKLFSRIAFLLDTPVDAEHIGVACKKTVRNRDLESTSFQVDLASSELTPFESYTESQFFDFADLYFAGEGAPTP